MPKKPKRGRPPLPKAACKQARLICRMSKADEREIGAAAHREKKTKSDWIRETLLRAAKAVPPQQESSILVTPDETH